jgi:hypothetical protein
LHGSQTELRISFVPFIICIVYPVRNSSKVTVVLLMFLLPPPTSATHAICKFYCYLRPGLVREQSLWSSGQSSWLQIQRSRV